MKSKKKPKPYVKAWLSNGYYIHVYKNGDVVVPHVIDQRIKPARIERLAKLAKHIDDGKKLQYALCEARAALDEHQTKAPPKEMFGEWESRATDDGSQLRIGCQYIKPEDVYKVAKLVRKFSKRK